MVLSPWLQRGPETQGYPPNTPTPEVTPTMPAQAPFLTAVPDTWSRLNTYWGERQTQCNLCCFLIGLAVRLHFIWGALTPSAQGRPTVTPHPVLGGFKKRPLVLCSGPQISFCFLSYICSSSRSLKPAYSRICVGIYVCVCVCVCVIIRNPAPKPHVSFWCLLTLTRQLAVWAESLLFY